MKKHLVLLMNIVLITLVIGAIIFTVLRVVNARYDAPDTVSDETTAAETSALATEADAPEPTVPDEKYRIGIIQHGVGEISDDCYAGFISELNERGLLEHIEVVYVIEDDKDLCKQKIQKLIDDGCDLLYTIGAYASKTAASLTTEIPIVFGAVTDPEDLGLVESNESPGGNVTGVSSYTPCFEQIDLIPMILPDSHSVAAIYSGTDEDAVIQAIIASKEAERIGLDFERYPVSGDEDLDEELAKIAESDAEVIYVPVDKLIEENIKSVVAFSLEHDVPIICGDEPTLEKGALATSGINYNSIGRKSATLAYDILYVGKDTATLPVIYKYDCDHKVNQDTLKALGLTLPDEATDEVELVSYDTSAAE